MALETNVRDLEGHGLAFTIGRGNEVCVAGIDALAPLVVGRTLEEIRADPAGFWREGREQRLETILRNGYPAYTTSAGWLGYDDERIRRHCREALAGGWTAFKLKVGADLDDDRRRLRIVRQEIGPDRRLMIDAN